MDLPLQIAFRKIRPSPAIEAAIRERAARLERFYDHILACRVVVEAPHHHHHHGNLYHLRLDISVPGEELVIDRAPGGRHEHEDMNVVIRDAFDAAQRKLADWVRERRGFTKTHTEPPHGHVARLFGEEGYGFIETPDGREIYFHEHSVLGNGFGRLAVGDEVWFAEETGEKGPQASTVHVAGKHRRA